MTWKCSAILALCIAASGCQSESAQQNSAPANANAAGTTAKSAPTDLKELARRVVAQNVNVKEGEIVRITGSPRDMELLENIFIEVEKVGAHPMLSVTTDSHLGFTDVTNTWTQQELIPFQRIIDAG